MGRTYTQLLSDVEHIQLPLERTDYADNIYWVYGIVLDNDLSPNAEDCMKILKNKNVGTRPFFYPMHKQPVFNKMGLFTGESYPVAGYISDKGFYLPSGLALTEEEISQAARALKETIYEFS